MSPIAPSKAASSVRLISSSVIAVLTIISTACSSPPSSRKSGWNRSASAGSPSPAEKELIEKFALKEPAQILFGHKIPRAKEELCTSDQIQFAFPLKIKSVVSQPPTNLKGNDKTQWIENEKANLRDHVQSAYEHLSLYPFSETKKVGFGRKLDLNVLPLLYVEDRFTNYLKNSMVSGLASIKRNFIQFQGDPQLYLGHLKVQKIVYKVGARSFLTPQASLDHPKHPFYVVVKKNIEIPLRDFNLQGRPLRRGLFMPLTVLRHRYILNIPADKQDEWNFSRVGREKDYFGYGKSKSIQLESTFQPRILVYQNDKIWGEYLKKFTRVETLPSGQPSEMRFQISIDMTGFCRYGMTKKRLLLDER